MLALTLDVGHELAIHLHEPNGLGVLAALYAGRRQGHQQVQACRQRYELRHCAQ